MGGRADERWTYGGAPARATAFEQCSAAAGACATALEQCPPAAGGCATALEQCVPPVGLPRATRGSAATSLRPCVPACLRACAFTLVELLVVITIIGLLIAVIALVGSRVLHAQKINLTKMIMKNVAVALDQFAAEDPLRGTYDKRGAATFGAYPPYMLAGGGQGAPPSNVPAVVEPYAQYSPNGSYSYVLQDRLHRDLNSRQGSVNDWARVPTGSGDPNDSNDDIRALYIYLKLYSPGALSQIPQTALKPIPARNRVDMVYPKGGADPNSAVDVFGIYDAWGVPFDYFLYVKLEWGPPRSGSLNLNAGNWYVVDRKPVLRSRGITLDEYKAAVVAPDKWIFSEDFPLPAADPNAPQMRSSGRFANTGAQYAGWVRVPGSGDLDPNSFGYVP